MKIAILGTRGIPNAYGGFEQFAEYLSVYLVNKGHSVWVYNSHLHPYQKSEWQGVNIIHCKDWEDKIGTAGQFFYDLNCIRDCHSRAFDIILQLGYTSSSVWAKLLPKNSKIITNMDGLEWKRSKFSSKVQMFLKKAEKWAIKSSDQIVADSLGIKSYLDQKYSLNAEFIAYGAPVAPVRDLKILNEYELEKGKYNILVARMEPENSVEIILDGYSKTDRSFPFVVVGKTENEFGKYLKNKFKNDQDIIFIGGVYELEKLDCLRQNCHLYFHGHTVGGTNPSLLEAMGCGVVIVANDNQFNKSILEEDAYYFKNANDIENIIDKPLNKLESEKMIARNISKVKSKYNWDVINSQYETLMRRLLNSN